MSTKVTGRESDQFALRLPNGMRDRIKAAAADNNRSMNAEIVATLEEKYPLPINIEQLSFANFLLKFLNERNHKELAEKLSFAISANDSRLIEKVFSESTLIAIKEIKKSE